MPTISKKWKPVYSTVLVEYMKNTPVNQIAKLIGKSKPTVHAIINRADFQNKIGGYKKDAILAARQHLNEALTEAAEKMCNIMRNGKANQRIQLDAAKEILHISGIKPIEVVETRTREYTPEEIKSALSVTKEIEQINERLSRSSSRFIVTQRIKRSSTDLPLAPASVGVTSDNPNGGDTPSATPGTDAASSTGS